MKPWAIAVLVLAAVLTETALARPSEADGNEDGYQEDQEADGDDRDAPGPAAPPVLKSTSLNLTPQPGETITLPCVVENAPTVVWLNGSATLAVGANRLTYKDDDRLMFNQDHSMTIKNIRASDSNKYECKIGNSLSVVHTVKVYEAGSGAPIERISFGLILGSVAVLLARV